MHRGQVRLPHRSLFPPRPIQSCQRARADAPWATESQHLAGPLHQRGGAPWVRSSATIYVGGLPSRLHVKIFSVPDCLFCDIAAGAVPATIVSETPGTIAIKDVSPQAPVHVLVLPRSHVSSLTELSTDRDLLLEIMAHAVAVARSQDGIADDGYRVVFNTGPEGGQTVGHVHAHVLGGRQMNWPPG
jgi:histidine triad (HIT) family protein